VNLDEFISSVLADVAKGVHSANAKLKGERPELTKGPFLIGHNADQQAGLVEFDIAVVASESQEGSGTVGARLFVADAGVEGKLASAREHTSRVKFGVRIDGYLS